MAKKKATVQQTAAKRVLDVLHRKEYIQKVRLSVMRHLKIYHIQLRSSLIRLRI